MCVPVCICVLYVLMPWCLCGRDNLGVSALSLHLVCPGDPTQVVRLDSCTNLHSPRHLASPTFVLFTVLRLPPCLHGPVLRLRLPVQAYHIKLEHAQNSSVPFFTQLLSTPCPFGRPSRKTDACVCIHTASWISKSFFILLTKYPEE